MLASSGATPLPYQVARRCQVRVRTLYFERFPEHSKDTVSGDLVSGDPVAPAGTGACRSLARPARHRPYYLTSPFHPVKSAFSACRPSGTLPPRTPSAPFPAPDLLGISAGRPTLSSPPGSPPAAIRYPVGFAVANRSRTARFGTNPTNWLFPPSPSDPENHTDLAVPESNPQHHADQHSRQSRRLARLGSVSRISSSRVRSRSPNVTPATSGAWATTVPHGSTIMLRPKQVRSGSWLPICPAAST